jgi:aminoglycoside/choline kinase family phosphotransferase
VTGDPRSDARRAFLAGAGWAAAAATPVAGDASTRLYERLTLNGRTAILMDAPPGPDGPPIAGGKSYSAIVHLAEDMRPFAAIALHLTAHGFSAPELYALDLGQGFILLEDLGNGVFADRIAAGDSEEALYGEAVDVLAALHALPVPGPLDCGDDGAPHSVPVFDDMAMLTEARLLPDWYAPLATGKDLSSDAQAAFDAAWQETVPAVHAMPDALVLRDYHSPNLLAIDGRAGLRHIGLIDFQDALIAPGAYDVVSLLQDARRTIPADLEARLLARYEAARAAQGTDFDAAAFRTAYAIMGAQRNTKIIGIFARLLLRDGKPHYLAHIPRLADYLARDLAHPALAPVAHWYDAHMPLDIIRTQISPDRVAR